MYSLKKENISLIREKFVCNFFFFTFSIMLIFSWKDLFSHFKKSLEINLHETQSFTWELAAGLKITLKRE